jgi:hypothetical protein
MSVFRVRAPVFRVRAPILGILFAALVTVAGTGAAHASFSYLSPGITCSPVVRDKAYVDNLLSLGLADPGRNYFTPGVGGPGSSCAGGDDRGYRNSYAINHDINVVTSGFLGFIDILTPLLGLNHRDIAIAAGEVVEAVSDAVGAVWDFTSDLFRTVFTNIREYDLSLPPLELSFVEFDQGFFDFRSFDGFLSSPGGGDLTRPRHVDDGDDDGGEFTPTPDP